MATKRGYQRTDRVNELLREIIAEELARQDDDALALLTITAVDVDREFDRAKVFYSSVDGDDDNEARREALEHFRLRAKRAVSRQARLRKTPELVFLPDDVVRHAQRIEDILKHLNVSDS
jgi:ribosome-binding factor A